MAKVKFTQNAQVRGHGYLKGQTAELDDATAEAYINVGQAVLADDADEPKTAKRKTAKRGGRRAETASKPGGGEKR